MSGTDPNADAPAPEQAPAPQMPEAERQALIRDTLRTLQDAFSAPGEEDDAGTVAELTHSAPSAATPAEEPAP